MMPELEIITGSGLGSLLGMRHALEPDHVAAVSTLVTGERSSARAAWLGACWGLGHTLTLMAAGAMLLVLRAEMPTVASEAFELCVVLMLVGLGVRALYQAARQDRAALGGRLPRQYLSPCSVDVTCAPRGGQGLPGYPTPVDVHPGAPARVHIGPWTLARRPLLVGAVHGLAGSGALTAVVVATLPSTAARLTSLALFGIGSTVGMAALSGLLGWPIARLGSHRAIARGVSLAVGCISTVLGLFWGYPLIGRLF